MTFNICFKLLNTFLNKFKYPFKLRIILKWNSSLINNNLILQLECM